MPMRPHVGLLTDFGTRAGYVASMKGVMLSIYNDCTIVDLSHDITPQSIIEAALFLENCCEYFPDGFVFLAVVDPGVGTTRKMLCLRTSTRQQIFIAPDNGLLDLVMKAQGVSQLVSIENRLYWRGVPSWTFHGRDIMGPVAAHVAAGVDIGNLGPPMDPNKAVRLVLPSPVLVSKDGSIAGAVLYTDHFGNMVTNIRTSDVEKAGIVTGDVLEIHLSTRTDLQRPAISAPLKHTYAEVGMGEFLCLINSENRFELAVNQGSAVSTTSMSGSGHLIMVRCHDRH
jgi:S-adenosylmethionine hydrolase